MAMKRVWRQARATRPNLQTLNVQSLGQGAPMVGGSLGLPWPLILTLASRAATTGLMRGRRPTGAGAAHRPWQFGCRTAVITNGGWAHTPGLAPGLAAAHPRLPNGTPRAGARDLGARVEQPNRVIGQPVAESAACQDEPPLLTRKQLRDARRQTGDSGGGNAAAGPDNLKEVPRQHHRRTILDAAAHVERVSRLPQLASARRLTSSSIRGATGCGCTGLRSRS